MRHSARKRPLNASMNALSVGFSRSREVERDAALVSPQIEIARHKLSALVDPDRCRQSYFSPDSFQHLDNIRTRKEKRGSSAGEKRENVSTIVNSRSLRPVAS